MRSWISQRIECAHAWWKAPVTARDRMSATVIGGMGGFWIGALGRILFGSLPVGVTVVLLWGTAGILAGAVFGRLRPKATLVFLLPFATFGCAPA